ncbi:MAG: aminotransferase class V-fold PLP-dependent enzyme, partial [Pedobacter sp.]
HGNNELGNLNDIHQIAACCRNYGAIFHSDTVQTMGHSTFDTNILKADFLVGSAHKFHGPKGVGFLYKRADDPIVPFINGGAQETGQRSGTENVAGIVGLARALELARNHHDDNAKHLYKLKSRMIARLQEEITDVVFNGNTLDPELSLNSILSISLPIPEGGIPILNYLDRHNICASGGSACSSHLGSHVLQALGVDFGRSVIRFSFSHLNTPEEIDYTVSKLSALFNPEYVTELVCVQ